MPVVWPSNEKATTMDYVADILIVIAISMIIIAIAIPMMFPHPQPQAKNRVPTMPQVAAPVPPPAPKKEEEPKEGRAEHTGIGVITEVVEIRKDEDAFIAFTFQEDGGFQKRFYPVCSNQVLQTGRPISILYHWKAYDHGSGGSHDLKGCFVIDGYQTK